MPVERQNGQTKQERVYAVIRERILSGAYGPGYRVYFIQRGAALVVLLAGGDKRTQDRDIATARALAREL